MQCWKPNEEPFNGKICCPLTAYHLDEWTSAWLKNAATLFTPPDSSVFSKLKNDRRPGNRRGKTASITPEPAASTPVTTFNVNIDKSLFNAKSDSSPVKPSTKAEEQHIFSAITEYPPSEWNGQGLLDFLTYCRDKYHDKFYVDVYEALAEERLGIHVYKAAIDDKTIRESTLHDLRTYGGIKSGMLKFWLTDFAEWYAKIKKQDPLIL
jgi:hypothetical protein